MATLWYYTRVCVSYNIVSNLANEQFLSLQSITTINLILNFFYET